MRLAALLLIVATVLALAFAGLRLGSVGDPGPSPSVSNATADPGPANLVDTGPDDVNRTGGNWSRLVFEGGGPAGSWVYAYQALPEPTDGISLNVTYNLRVDGDDGQRTVAVLAGPQAAIDEGDGFNVLDFPIDPPILLGEGGIERSVDRSFGLGVGSGAVTGVGFAVGADAPWNLSVAVVRPDADGPTTRPGYEHVNASGLTVYDDVSRLVSDLDDGANRVSLSGEIDRPGWTNLQILYDVIQPDDVRDIQVSFPDGTSYHGRMDRTGYKTLGSGCAATGGGEVSPVFMRPHEDLYGTYTNTPGGFDAQLTHVGASANVSMIAVHLPIMPGDLPAGNLQGGYASGWWPCTGTR